MPRRGAAEFGWRPRRSSHQKHPALSDTTSRCELADPRTGEACEAFYPARSKPAACHTSRVPGCASAAMKAAAAAASREPAATAAV